MTPEGFLFAFLAFIILICIIVVITVASTISSTVAAVVDDEDGEEPVIVSLYTSDGEHLKLKCAEKLKCDTTAKINSKNVLNLSWGKENV